VHDRDWLQPCGLWKPRTTYGKWSQAILLYKVPSWQRWMSYMGQRSKAANQEFHNDFYTPALSLRSGWFDRVLVALPFSPEPPTRPSIQRTGSMFLDQRMSVQPDGVLAYVAAMRDVVIPAAQARGLRLELFARALGKPTDYHALWSVAGAGELADWRAAYDVEAPAPNLPGLEAAWPYIVEFEERDLMPSTTSPLGGRTPHIVGEPLGAGPTPAGPDL